MTTTSPIDHFQLVRDLNQWEADHKYTGGNIWRDLIDPVANMAETCLQYPDGAGEVFVTHDGIIIYYDLDRYAWRIFGAR